MLEGSAQCSLMKTSWQNTKLEINSSLSIVAHAQTGEL